MSDSVERVRAALLVAGHPDSIAVFPEGTRTAQDAANAVGCTVAQIAKSIVLRAGEQPVLVIASGANRVDTAKIAERVGQPVKPAVTPGWRASTAATVSRTWLMKGTMNAASSVFSACWMKRKRGCCWDTSWVT